MTLPETLGSLGLLHPDELVGGHIFNVHACVIKAYAIICHYLSPEGHEDVRKFSAILENRHSEASPIAIIL